MIEKQMLNIFFNSSSGSFIERLILGIEEQNLLNKLRKSKERCFQYNIEDIYNIYVNVIKDEYQSIIQKQQGIKKLGYEIKSKPLSPMQVDAYEGKPESLEVPSTKVTYEDIIQYEYKVINIKSEQTNPVKQEQDLTGSKESKEKYIKMIKSLCLQMLEMLEWLERDISFFSNDLGNVLSKVNFLYWTEDLVIDKGVIAKHLIDNGFLDSGKSYELACLCCLKSSIGNLWSKLAKEEKKKYSENEDISPLVRFWTYKIERKEKEWVEENYEYLLKCVTEDGNEVAVKYLLNYLSKLEQKPKVDVVALAVTVASTSSFSHFYTYYTPILLELFDVMSNEERDKVYKERPYDVLIHLMNLKSKECYEMMESVWKTRPSRSAYQALLDDIANKIVEGDSNYRQIFMAFWNKIYEVNEGEEIDRVGEQLLPYLFQFDEKEIKEILDSAIDNEKKKIIEYVKSDRGLSPKYCNPWLLELVVTSCFECENEESRKFIGDLISSGKGLEICTYLISNGKFEEFKKFFSAVNEQDKFRNQLFKMRGNDIFVNLYMIKDGQNVFDQFVSWYFNDESKEKKFKQGLALSRIGIETIINTVLRSNDDGYTWEKYQDKFIEWSGLQENEFIVKFQGEQSGSMRRCDICINLFLEQSSKLADDFLSWCFLSDKKKVDEFKKDFVNGDKAVNFCVNKIKTNKLYAVENFLEGFILSEEERGKLLNKCKDLLPDQQQDVEFAFSKNKKCKKAEDCFSSYESSIEKMEVEVALSLGNSIV